MAVLCCTTRSQSQPGTRNTELQDSATWIVGLAGKEFSGARIIRLYWRDGQRRYSLQDKVNGLAHYSPRSN